MLTARLAENGIRLPHRNPGNQKVLCPQCSASRKPHNRRDPCLSVKIDAEGATWNCKNCEWKGAVNFDEPAKRSEPPRRHAPKAAQDSCPAQPIPRPGALPAEATDWFWTRGIERETLSRAGVAWSTAWFPDTQKSEPCVMFPFRRDGETVNAKFRPVGRKTFTQTKGGEKSLFLLDLADTEYSDRLVICEGEIDALSLMQAGVENAVSVPDGAPKEAKVDEIIPENDRAFSYVWSQRESIDRFQRIVLATDGDAPGRALAEELSRRLDRERCLLVTWPEGCKDANEVLVRLGAAKLVETIDAAQPYPIKSVYSVDAFWPDVMSLWEGERKPAFSTGWPSIDEFMRIREGELSVVTGIPGSGKSEFIDALLVNLARNHGWRFAVCSFENPPDEHIAKLLEKYLHKPFRPGPTARMVPEEMATAKIWLRQHFVFIRAEDESPTMDWVMEKASAAVAQYGVNGLVIDPYNELEHRRPSNMSETEYVSDILGKVKRLAAARGIHVWFVAHPAKLQPEKPGGSLPVPTLYSISGSANWVNKADIGIVVARDANDGVDIHVRKVRFKASGRQGTVRLRYDKVTGEYHEPLPPAARWAGNE